MTITIIAFLLFVTTTGIHADTLTDFYPGTYSVTLNDTLFGEFEVSDSHVLVVDLTDHGEVVAEKTSTIDVPYPWSDIGIEFDWSTRVRDAVGSDNWPITWGADDEQYASWGDGNGFDGSVRTPLGVARVVGRHPNFTGTDLWQASSENGWGGKSYGIIDVDGTLYMWVVPGSLERNWDYVRLATSTDGGYTWDISERFVEESDGVGIPTFLQFGRGYEGSRDEYVYSYFIGITDPDHLIVQFPGEFYLARVPASEIRSFERYEWYGSGGWHSDIGSRTPVFYDANGACRVGVSYNPTLDRYLLATEHTRDRRGKLGIFAAPEPWGPWETVYYRDEGSWDDRSFFWNFSNKWNDGLDFVMVYTGKDDRDSWNSVEGRFIVTDPVWKVDVGTGAAGDWVALDHMTIPERWDLDAWCGDTINRDYYVVDDSGFVAHERENQTPIIGRFWHAGYSIDPYSAWAVFRTIPAMDEPFTPPPGQFETCMSEPDGDDWVIVGTYCGLDVARDSCYVEVVDMGLRNSSVPPWCNEDTDWDARTVVWPNGCIVIRLARWHLPCVVRVSGIEDSWWMRARVVPPIG